MESIVVERATKRFTLRHAHSIKEMTVRAARRQRLSERFTALDEVSLTVEQGESLALMGLNGSGKSTLLKLISGVMRPDGGSARVRGRVAGLIEVGAGLHPDLTGRENIFLNAGILGMSKAETEAKYDAIVAFSEIEKFLDTQVKFYSSGMFMRLGFSVAVHTEPDVFLVDEVLAVGDPPFQKKCLDRIQELHAEGRTLVIVSHDMGTLEKVCDRGFVLREGQVAYEGAIHDAVDFLAPPENALEAERRKRAREEAKADQDEAWQEYAAETGLRYRCEGYTEGGEQVVPRITGVGTAVEPVVPADEDTAAVVPDARTAPVPGAPAAPAREETAAKPVRGRLRELDLLRFVAAVAVMMHHFTGVPQGSWNGDPRIIFPGLSMVTRFGHLGVNLFFLISGFVIVMSVWNRTPGEFAISRITRLFPAYWAGVVLSFALYEIPGLVGAPAGTILRFLPNLTMLQSGVGAGPLEVPYWTLWVELHFYVLVALFVWRGVTYGRCVAFMAAWLFAGVFAQEANSAFLKAMLITDWAPYFIAGMAFFLIYRYGSNIVLWLIVGCCWALGVFYALRTVLPWQAWPGVHQYVFPAVITFIFVLMALVALHRLSWLRWRPLTIFGALTYPLYLLHETVSRVVIKQLDTRTDPRIVVGLAVAAALVSAYVVHRFVERPAQPRLRAALKKAAGQIRAQRTSGETSR